MSQAQIAVTVHFPELFHAELEEEIRREWRELHYIGDDVYPPGRHMPYDKWSVTNEGRLHYWLIHTYFLGVNPKIVLSERELNVMQSRLQRRSTEVRGRPVKYNPAWHDLKSYRAYKSWKLLNIIEAAKGAPLTPCPLSIEWAVVPEPQLYSDMGKRFEKFTGIELPQEAHDKIAKWDEDTFKMFESTFTSVNDPALSEKQRAQYRALKEYFSEKQSA